MKPWSLSASTAIAIALSAGVSFAVTPEEVWENWKALTVKGGGTLTSTAEVRNGATLEISGVTASQTVPEFSMTVEIGTVTMTDRGDGTVEVKTADSYPMVFSDPGAAGGPSATVTVTQPGASLIASGTAASVNYDFSYPTLNITLTELKDPSDPGIDVKADLAITDLTGKYTATPDTGDLLGFDYTLNAGNLVLTSSGTNASLGESFTGSFGIAGLAAAAKGTTLPQDKMQDMAAALKEGFFVDSTATSGAMTVAFDFTDSTGPTSFSGALDGTTVRLGLDQTRVDYGFSLTGGKVAVNAPSAGMPPMDGTFGEIALGLLLPVAKTDTPQPMGVLAKLVDISLSDAIWGMVDPGAQLPRDPATMIVDLDGTGAWSVDILDPAVQSGQVPMPAMPGTLNSLDLTQVLLQIVGGEVTATGGLTFDNSDLMTFGGIPAPEGKISVTMKGINALIDKLVAMGILGEQDVSQFRFGLAMFARPGAGPDELVSEIEFKDKGLFVNDQQLQ